MAYRDFSTAEIRKRLATVATVATFQAPTLQTVANAATVAGVEPKFEKSEARDFEREERLAVYGETEADAVQERGDVRKNGGDRNRFSEQNSASVSDIDLSRNDAGRFEDSPADWLPEPSPGIRILRPAVELSAVDYDKHLDVLIAALPAGSVEAQRLTFAKRKGWVVECEGRRIFTRGRF